MPLHSAWDSGTALCAKGRHNTRLGAFARSLHRVRSHKVRTSLVYAASSCMLKSPPPSLPPYARRRKHTCGPVKAAVDIHAVFWNILRAVHRRTYLFPHFMDDERADHIVKIAEKRLAPSGLAFRKGDSAENSR